MVCIILFSIFYLFHNSSIYMYFIICTAHQIVGNSAKCVIYLTIYVERNGLWIELPSLEYENPGSNPVLR